MLTTLRRKIPRIAVVLVALTGLSACLLLEQNVELTFENASGQPFCIYLRYSLMDALEEASDDAATSNGCFWEVGANRQKTTFFECGDGSGADALPVAVVITLQGSNQPIYQRTEKCRTWQRSNRTFVIKERGGEAVVADPFD